MELRVKVREGANGRYLYRLGRINTQHIPMLSGCANGCLAAGNARNQIVIGHILRVSCVLNTTFDNNRVAACFTKPCKEARTIISLVREKGIRKITIELHEGKAKTAKSEFALQTLTPEELNNAIVSKKFTEWKVLKQAENELFVQVTKSYKFDN